MASREVLVDTSGLSALVVRKDAHHPAARTVVEQLHRGGRRFVATDYVLAETVNLANASSGRRVAIRVQSAGIRIEWIGTPRFDSTKSVLPQAC